MVDYKPRLTSTLSSILPTYYELFCDSQTEKPCITYIETNNKSLLEGDTLRFSDLAFTIKVWDTDIEHATSIALQVDVKMKELGFKRAYSNELSINGNFVKIINYEAIGFEIGEI